MYTHVLSMPIFGRVFTINSCWVFLKPFLHLLDRSYSFHSSFCYCGLPHWSVCWYWTILAFLVEIPLNYSVQSVLTPYSIWTLIFVQDFCIYVLQGYWLIIFFSFDVFVWFWYQVSVGLVELVQKKTFTVQYFGLVWKGCVTSPINIVQIHP